MDNPELREAAAAQTRGNIIMLFLITLVWGLVLLALMAGPVIYLAGEVANVNTFEALIDHIAVFLLFVAAMIVILTLAAGIMEYGMIANQHRMFKREEAAFGAGFEGFKRPGACIGTFFMREAFLFLWFLIPIAGFVFIFIKYYSYSCAFYIIQEDHSQGPIDAITKSKSIMEGKKVRMFRLDLYYFLVWYLPGIFTLGVAWIWGIPRHMQARYNFYQMAKTEKQRQVGN